MTEFLTTDQVAQRWGVTRACVASWRANKIGPPFIKLMPGARGAVRYRLSDIEEWERKMENLRPVDYPKDDLQQGDEE